MANADVVQAATGQSSIEDALAWIAEGHPLKPEIRLQELLQAVVGTGGGENHQGALRRVARAATESDLDTASAIYNPDLLEPLRCYKSILDLLARKSPTRTLCGLTPEAVGAAQHEVPTTMEVFCAIAGLSFRDLKERVGDELPNRSSGHWRASAIAAAFSVVDGIVRGIEKTTSAEGAIPLRPIELLLNSESAGGWAEIEKMRCSGVPYEWLLAQRTVGSAWGSHRNRTSSKLLGVVASRLCAEFDRLGVRYRWSKSVGGDIRPSEVRRLAGGGSHIGIVALTRDGTPICGVAFSIARDGGTARKNAGRLQAMVARTHVPVALVVAGPGWSLRNETADMAAAFAGRVYSDRTICLLAQAIHDHLIGHSKEV